MVDDGKSNETEQTGAGQIPDAVSKMLGSWQFLAFKDHLVL